jgi:regulator of cell morphogenesis and NO signaling
MQEIHVETTSSNGVELAQQTIGQIVAEHPGRAQIFEKFGIDYCCGGKKLLTQACAEKALELSQVLQAITAYDASHSAVGTDWTRASMTELADHIIAAHHDYLRANLPRLSYLTNRVKNAHGARHPELIELDAVFNQLRAGLESHTMKEEVMLFPSIKQLDRGEIPTNGCAVAHAVTVMEAEHDEAGGGLQKIRELTNDFTPPSDTCNTHRALLFSLQELESDLHKHIHKENSILFPRAVERQRELLAS